MRLIVILMLIFSLLPVTLNRSAAVQSPEQNHSTRIGTTQRSVDNRVVSVALPARITQKAGFVTLLTKATQYSSPIYFTRFLQRVSHLYNKSYCCL